MKEKGPIEKAGEAHEQLKTFDIGEFYRTGGLVPMDAGPLLAEQPHRKTEEAIKAPDSTKAADYAETIEAVRNFGEAMKDLGRLTAHAAQTPAPPPLADALRRFVAAKGISADLPGRIRKINEEVGELGEAAAIYHRALGLFSLTVEGSPRHKARAKYLTEAAHVCMVAMHLMLLEGEEPVAFITAGIERRLLETESAKDTGCPRSCISCNHTECIGGNR